MGEERKERIEDAILRSVDSLGVWKRGGLRAPHKPLLVLLALARVREGRPRLAEFTEIEEPLADLLRRFGPPRRSVHPEYPFWWLRSDGLWEVPGGEDLPLRGKGKEPLVSVVRDRGVEGGFPAEIHEALLSRPGLVGEVARRLLDAHFPASLHAEILDAVGLGSDAWTTRRTRKRDSAFAEIVLNAYEHRCAFCGMRLLLDRQVVALEAAHVRWHAGGGPSTVENGLALCPLHHKLLDLGGIGLSDRHEILVSSRALGGGVGDPLVEALHGRPVLGPQRGHPKVGLAHIRWHREEVFRPPPRAAG